MCDDKYLSWMNDEIKHKQNTKAWFLLNAFVLTPFNTP